MQCLLLILMMFASKVFLHLYNYIYQGKFDIIWKCIYPKKAPKNVKIDGSYDKIVDFIYLTAAALNFVLVWLSVDTLNSKVFQINKTFYTFKYLDI